MRVPSLLAVLLCVVTALVPAAPSSAATLGPARGALFGGDYRTTPHFCSGAVVHSSARNLVATAAHCVVGTGTALQFVPGYNRGSAPYGAWQVVAVYVDARWRASHDPHHDVAFLRVARVNGRRIESRVRALRLAVAAPAGTRETMSGYLAGTNDRALHCTHRTYRHAGYPAINCRGFGGGTSGGPWRTRSGRLVGVTGGLHQGGCSPDTSYTAPFGAATLRLWQRAERGGSGDTVSPAGPDGCPPAQRAVLTQL